MAKHLSYSSGDVFGRLMLTGKAYLEPQGRHVECICECGGIIWPLLVNLKKNNTKSCGCYHVDVVSTHGLSRHPLYKGLQTVIARCYNPNATEYENYGARGITVCQEWQDDFMSFYNWSMNNGWGKGLQLDRFPNNKDGNYEPTNCRWATSPQQNRNKSNNVNLTAFGETKCVQDWVSDPRCSINGNSIKKRLKKGWTHEDAICKPSTTYNKDYVYKK